MRAIALTLVLTGCTCASAATPAPTSTPPPPTPTPTSTTTVAPPAAPSDAELARRAYLAAVDAYDARDPDAYFAAFEPTLFCFYGTADVPLDRVRRERWRTDAPHGVLVSVELSVLSQTEDEVVLRDRGFFRSGQLGDASLRQLLHQKIVVMRRTEGTWRIAGETSSTRLECMGDRVPMSLGSSTTFDTCRTAHDACFTACNHAMAQHTCSIDEGTCQSCGLDCQDAALRCLGAHVLARVPLEGATAPTTVRTEDDVRRFVTLSMAEDDAELPMDPWLDAARQALGAPFFRMAEYDVGVICSSSLTRPIDVWVEYQEERTVRDVHCATDAAGVLARCVATIDVDDDRAIDLTLAFDGGRLRAVHRDVRARGPAPSDLLDRYATAHPPEWDATCPEALVALAEDRVGDDFFVVHDGEDDEMRTISVHRFCGAQARTEVHALGEAWACDDEGCESEYGCGNGCETIVLDAEHRVLAFTSGRSGSSDFYPAWAPRARQEIPCGRTRAFLPDQDEDEDE